MIFEKAASFRCHLKSVLCHEAVGCRGTPVCQRAHQVLHENRANPGRLAQKHTQLRRRPLQRQNARPRRHLCCAAGAPSPCAGPALLTRARSRCPLRMFPALRLLSFVVDALPRGQPPPSSARGGSGPPRLPPVPVVRAPPARRLLSRVGFRAPRSAAPVNDVAAPRTMGGVGARRRARPAPGHSFFGSIF